MAETLISGLLNSLLLSTCRWYEKTSPSASVELAQIKAGVLLVMEDPFAGERVTGGVGRWFTSSAAKLLKKLVLNRSVPPEKLIIRQLVPLQFVPAF